MSAPSHIAQGQARHSTGEFVQFLSHAEGSVAEPETQLVIAVELAYCSLKQAQEAFDPIPELRRMLNALG